MASPVATSQRKVSPRSHPYILLTSVNRRRGSTQLEGNDGGGGNPGPGKPGSSDVWLFHTQPRPRVSTISIILKIPSLTSLDRERGAASMTSIIRVGQGKGRWNNHRRLITMDKSHTEKGTYPRYPLNEGRLPPPNEEHSSAPNEAGEEGMPDRTDFHYSTNDGNFIFSDPDDIFAQFERDDGPVSKMCS
jgi:hypothetical protein